MQFFNGSTFLILLYLASCSKLKSEQKAEDKPSLVNTAVATRSAHSDSIDFPARVLSQSMSSITSPSAGRILKIHTHLGALVSAGDPLFSLKNLDAAFEFSTVLVRARSRAQVWKINAAVGSEIQKGDPVVSLMNPDHLELRLEIPETDSKLFENAARYVLIQNNDTQSDPITLDPPSVSPMVDLQTGTKTALFLLSKKLSQKLSPGDIIYVRAESPERQSILVSQEAINYRGQGPQVLVLDENNKATLQSVQLGATSSKGVEILSGLKEGDIFVTSTTRYVSSGEIVSIFTENKKQEKKTAR